MSRAWSIKFPGAVQVGDRALSHQFRQRW